VHVAVDQTDQTPLNVVVGAPDVRVGEPYDADRIDRELTKYATAMRDKGYLEARASHTAEFTAQGADVTLQVFRGPHVTIAFSGDPIPSGERDRLVPIRTEASVNQDILEDSQNAILTYLRTRGYRDATVEFTSVEKDNELILTFTIQHGPHYTVDGLSVTGNTVIGSMELVTALRLKKGEPFVQGTLDGGATIIRNMYRNLGYAKADVKPVVTVQPNTQSQDVERRVDIAVAVTEGAKTVVRSVTFKGNAAIPEADLRKLLLASEGKAYSEVDLVADRDRVELEYRNRGYEDALVTPSVQLADNDTQADITLTISEAQQIFVDHVIINGNKRTKASTIERELVLKPGQPMGSAAMIESQQRLSALGLFRRVRLTEVAHGGDPKRDLLVTVEEAPPNTQAFGAGLEVGSILRTSETGTAEERVEFVPRGSFEIGRRNMWGKNRSIDFFTRVALRSRDLVVTNGGLSLQQPNSSLGFNEYRVYTTYREPRIFDTKADLLLTALVDQARRSSFNFNRREARAEVGLRVSPKYSVAGRYSFERTRLFDEAYTEAEKPLIDRLFPQVRLSKLSGTIIRDARENLLDPAGGTLVSVTTDVALRAIGSEVGFFKTYIESYAYPKLPVGRRTVLALGGRLGLAHGLSRIVDNELIEDIPASERFFAGGDTTVRGFSLDRLGSAGTITASGFPTGGNAVVIGNAELRMAMPWSLQAVTFLDIGNVFTKIDQIDFTELRPAVGVGARIKLPLITAPIRVDLGFNLHPQELVPGSGTFERRAVLHVSLGQAF
jgi:outer membrane protein insertion porin family